MLKQIQRLLETCGTEHEVFPATELYNEGWMLRIILDWFSHHSSEPHPLSFTPNARWFEILSNVVDRRLITRRSPRCLA